LRAGAEAVGENDLQKKFAAASEKPSTGYYFYRVSVSVTCSPAEQHINVKFCLTFQLCTSLLFVWSNKDKA